MTSGKLDDFESGQCNYTHVNLHLVVDGDHDVYKTMGSEQVF
jgi:hypothetical protein